MARGKHCGASSWQPPTPTPFHFLMARDYLVCPFCACPYLSSESTCRAPVNPGKPRYSFGEPTVDAPGISLLCSESIIFLTVITWTFWNLRLLATWSQFLCKWLNSPQLKHCAFLYLRPLAIAYTIVLAWCLWEPISVVSLIHSSIGTPTALII